MGSRSCTITIIRLSPSSVGLSPWSGEASDEGLQSEVFVPFCNGRNAIVGHLCSQLVVLREVVKGAVSDCGESVGHFSALSNLHDLLLRMSFGIVTAEMISHFIG